MELWTEKYRPKTLDEIRYHKDIVSTLKNLIKKKEIPHLIFTGAAGIGKTSIAWSLIHDFFIINYPNYKYLEYECVFERNASDEFKMSEGDIDALKDFIFQHNIRSNIPYKFVILDESDHLSHEIQNSLRRIIEQSKNVTFIFINNYIENLISPLISRCIMFKFMPLPLSECKSIIYTIIKNEFTEFTEIYNNINFDTLYIYTRGDIRKLINIIQIITKKNTDFNLYTYLGIMSDTSFSTFLSLCKNYQLQEFLNFTQFHFYLPNVLIQILTWVLTNSNSDLKLTEENKKKIILLLEEYDKYLIQNTYTDLQIQSFFLSIASIIGGQKI